MVWTMEMLKPTDLIEKMLWKISSKLGETLEESLESLESPMKKRKENQDTGVEGDVVTTKEFRNVLEHTRILENAMLTMVNEMKNTAEELRVCHCANYSDNEWVAWRLATGSKRRSVS